MGSQRVRHDWETELNWNDVLYLYLNHLLSFPPFFHTVFIWCILTRFPGFSLEAAFHVTMFLVPQSWLTVPAAGLARTLLPVLLSKPYCFIYQNHLSLSVSSVPKSKEDGFTSDFIIILSQASLWCKLVFHNDSPNYLVKHIQICIAYWWKYVLALVKCLMTHHFTTPF